MKSEKRESFFKGVVFLLIAQIFIKIMGLVYKLYITNKQGFGDEGNAIYNAGFSIYALLLTLSSVGVPNAVAKMISEKVSKGQGKEAHRILKVAFITFAIIGTIGTTMLFFGAKYISNVWLKIPEAEMTLIALSPSIFFVSITSVIRGFFNGIRKLSPTANSQIMEQLFKTVLTIILVEIVGIISGLDTKLMAAAANLATTFATLIGFLYIYKYYIESKALIKKFNEGKIIKKKVFRIIKEILSASIPISLSAILVSINGNIDAVTVKRGLMKFLEEDIAQKQYGILSGKVTTLVTLPLSFNIALSTALVPEISSLMARGEVEKVKRKVESSLLLSIIIGLPCTIGMIIFANPIFQLLFPRQMDGILIFQVSAIGIIFMVIEQTVNGSLQGLGKGIVPAIALSIGVVMKLILNIILVPMKQIGVLGAAIGTVMCHMISSIIVFNVLIKTINLQINFIKLIAKPLIASISMVVVSYLVFLNLKCIINIKVATIIALMVAVVIYFAILLLIGTFSTNMKVVLSNYLKRE